MLAGAAGSLTDDTAAALMRAIVSGAARDLDISEDRIVAETPVAANGSSRRTLLGGSAEPEEGSAAAAAAGTIAVPFSGEPPHVFCYRNVAVSVPVLPRGL